MLGARLGLWTGIEHHWSRTTTLDRAEPTQVPVTWWDKVGISGWKRLLPLQFTQSLSKSHSSRISMWTFPLTQKMKSNCCWHGCSTPNCSQLEGNQIDVSRSIAGIYTVQVYIGMTVLLCHIINLLVTFCRSVVSNLFNQEITFGI